MSKIKNYGTGLGVGVAMGSLTAGIIVLIYEEVKYQAFRKQRMRELVQEYPECEVGQILLGYAGIGGQYVDGIVCPNDPTLQNTLNQQLNTWAIAQAKGNLKTNWPALVIPAMVIITLLILSCCWLRSTVEVEDEEKKTLLPNNSIPRNNSSGKLLDWMSSNPTDKSDVTVALIAEQDKPEKPKPSLNF